MNTLERLGVDKLIGHVAEIKSDMISLQRDINLPADPNESKQQLIERFTKKLEDVITNTIHNTTYISEVTTALKEQ